MIAHPDIDPTAFAVFGWPVRWYGLAYLLAFAAAFFLGRRLLRRAAFSDLRGAAMDDLLLASVFGVILGGRLGYALFYNPAFYFADPLQIARLWDGGMSFHGGLLGVVAALFLYARKCALPFLRVADFAAVLTPVGLGCGRVGNFINGELRGRIADPDLPWAMVFPGESVARHPSSLYQAFLEGAVLFAALYFFAARRRPAGFLSGAFLLGYALLRMFSELFREPDAHLGFIVGGISMGQLLSIPMLLGGVLLLTMEKWLPLVRQKLSAAAPPVVSPEAQMRTANGEDMQAAAENGAPLAAAERAQPPDDAAEEDPEFAEDDKTEVAEKDDEEVSTASHPKNWWQKLFAADGAAEEEEISPRRRSRRDIRRMKKKRRRR